MKYQKYLKKKDGIKELFVIIWEKNYSLKVKKYEKFHPFQKKIKVTFIENNTIQIFNTKRDLCKKLNINRSTLKYALENNKGLMTRKKIKVEEIN